MAAFFEQWLVRRMASGAGGPSIPYPRVEYVEFTGSQYIDTGIRPDPMTFGYEYAVRFINNLSGTVTVAGCWGPNYNSDGYSTAVTGNYLSGYLCPPPNWRAGFSPSYAARLSDSVNYAAVSLINNNDWDGSKFTLALSSPLRNETLTYTNPYPSQTANSFLIGAIKTGYNGGISEKSHVKVYYFRLMRYNVPIMNLIPVRVGSIGYLYDTISKTLFGNLGSGYLGIGPDVDKMPYTLLEYVEGDNQISYPSGGMAITGDILDTGIYTNDDKYSFYADYMKLRTFRNWEGYFGDWLAETVNTWRIIQYSNDYTKCFANFNTISTGGGCQVNSGDLLNTRTVMTLNKDEVTIGNVTTQRDSSQQGTAPPNSMRLGSGRWYAFKTYDNGTLIQDLRPARSADNELCMVDILTDTLIHSPYLTTGGPTI